MDNGLTKYEGLNVYNEQEHRSCKMEVKGNRVRTRGIIYIDSVFAVNFVMDLYLLKLTAQALGKTATTRRVLGASLLGASGYCLVLLVPGISYLPKVFAGMIPVGLLTVKVLCQTTGVKELLYGVGCLFTFSFLIGGFMVFLKNLSAFRGIESSLLFTAAAGYGGYRLCRLGLEIYEKNRKNCFCHVCLPGDRGTVELKALIDTGNGLVEPVSKRPVAILEEESWCGLQRWMKPEKYKLIPYHSIGKEKGMMEGYEIETMDVTAGTVKKRYEKVIVAVCKGKISEKGGYQMILPPELSI